MFCRKKKRKEMSLYGVKQHIQQTSLRGKVWSVFDLRFKAKCQGTKLTKNIQK